MALSTRSCCASGRGGEAAVAAWSPDCSLAPEDPTAQATQLPSREWRIGRVGRRRAGGGHAGLALAPLAAAGDFASVDPEEPAAHGRIVAVRAGGPGGATLVRRMAVESGRSGLRAANPAGPTWR